jgi:hypothetical protein
MNFQISSDEDVWSPKVVSNFPYLTPLPQQLLGPFGLLFCPLLMFQAQGSV